MSQKRTHRDSTDEEQDHERDYVSHTSPPIEDDLDAVLADIDDVLEANAATFVSSYVQKGGE